MTPLRSKLAVVTGGSQGIGKATCWALAREGCRVVVIARTSADVTGLVQELCDDGHDAVAAPCDLSDSQAATVLFDRLQSDHGGVDILVNCAGVGDFGRFENATMEQLDLPVDVPLKLTLYACRLAVARMIAKGNGVIINVLTPASYFTLPNMAAYSASRWGLRGFTMSLHQELKHSGIHVGSICPGKVGTDYIANNDTDIRWWPRVSRFFPEQSPDEVAKHIVRAVKRRKRETIFPWRLWWFAKAQQWFPGTVVWFLERTGLFQPALDPGARSMQSPLLGEEASSATNWEESISLNASRKVYAQTIDDVVRVVTSPVEFPGPVRTAGSSHSTTHCGVADGGTLLAMRAMDKIISIDKQAMTVTAEAGALYIDVALALKEQGLQLYVNVEIGNLTMGSAACTGTKDASFADENGQVCSYLKSAKVVMADGSVRRIDDGDPELLQALRSSYGLLGVICEVTFAVKPLTALRVHHKTYTLDGFEEALPALCAEGDSMMYYLFPFTDTLTVEFRRYVPGKKPRGHKAWYVRNLAWKRLAPAFSALATRFVASRRVRYFFIGRFYRMLQLVLTTCIKSKSSFATDQIIRYPKKKGVSKYTFSIWAFPEETIMPTMRAYYAFCQDYYRDHGYRCDILNVGYRIKHDQAPLFSYSWSGNVMTLDPVCSVNEPGWDDFLKAYNQFCDDRGGVPLFNQSKWLTAEQTRNAFGERVDTFNRFRQDLDPGNRFQNAYFRSLFESGEVYADDSEAV